jgi:hypothetical protein
MAATKDKFFDAAKMAPRDRAAVTDDTAKAIIAAEAKARTKKTEKLRELRLQAEADNPTPPPEPKKRRVSTAPVKRKKAAVA